MKRSKNLKLFLLLLLVGATISGNSYCMEAPAEGKEHKADVEVKASNENYKRLKGNAQALAYKGYEAAVLARDVVRDLYNYAQDLPSVRDVMVKLKTYYKGGSIRLIPSSMVSMVDMQISIFDEVDFIDADAKEAKEVKKTLLTSDGFSIDVPKKLVKNFCAKDIEQVLVDKEFPAIPVFLVFQLIHQAIQDADNKASLRAAYGDDYHATIVSKISDDEMYQTLKFALKLGIHESLFNALNQMVVEFLAVNSMARSEVFIQRLVKLDNDLAADIQELYFNRIAKKKIKKRARE